jgi:hypothetical protein
MNSKALAAAAVALALGTAVAGASQATTLVYQFTEDGCSSSCFAPGVTSLGTMTIDDTGGVLAFTIDLVGAQFNANGNSEHHALVFDIDKTGLTIDDISAGFGLPTEKVKGKTVSDPGPFDAPPFGKGIWPYAIDYTGSAKQGDTPSELSFTVSDGTLHDLTLLDVKSPDVYGGFKIYAAADVYANGNTGNVGAIPEPTSWALMILGMGGVGGLLRRRRSATALA